MKILHITPWYEPAWSSGGTAVSVSNLCRGLVKLGAQVSVLTTTDMGAGKTLAKNSYTDELGGVRISYSACGIAGMSFRQGALSLELCKNIIKAVGEYDVVHIHSSRHIYGMIAAFACARAKVPYIITPHASLMPWWIEGIGHPFIKKLYIKLIDKYVLASASSLHFLSEFERDSSEKWSFNESSFVLPNGIVKPKVNGIKKKQGQQLRLLHVGRIHPQKNTLELIKAVCQLSPDDVLLDVIGAIDDAEYYQSCNNMISAKNATHIRILGAQTFEQVQEAYQNYDVFCMPSVVEGVSMALIEAASFGLPALVSEFVGNYREILADNAGILSDLDADSIATAIMSIINDNVNLEELKVNALSSVDKRYDIDVVTTSLLNTYKTITN